MDAERSRILGLLMVCPRVVITFVTLCFCASVGETIDVSLYLTSLSPRSAPDAVGSARRLARSHRDMFLVHQGVVLDVVSYTALRLFFDKFYFHNVLLIYRSFQLLYSIFLSQFSTTSILY